MWRAMGWLALKKENAITDSLEKVYPTHKNDREEKKVIQSTLVGLAHRTKK